MRVDGHKVHAQVEASASLGGESASVKVSTEKAVIKAGKKEVLVVRNGHGDYKVKMKHVHHGDHVSKKAAREIGEQAIKTVRKAAREEVRKHK